MTCLMMESFQLLFRCAENHFRLMYSADFTPQSFAACLKGYESTIFNSLSGNRSDATSKVQRILDIRTSGEVIPWRPRGNLNAVDCSRLCSVISAYRLLDVVRMLSGAHHASSMERRSFKIPNSSFRVSSVKVTNVCPELCAGNGQTGPLALSFGSIPEHTQIIK
jgi:hypothetical protein